MTFERALIIDAGNVNIFYVYDKEDCNRNER